MATLAAPAVRPVCSATLELLAAYQRYAALLPAPGTAFAETRDGPLLDAARHAFRYAVRAAPPYALATVFALAIDGLDPVSRLALAGATRAAH